MNTMNEESNDRQRNPGEAILNTIAVELSKDREQRAVNEILKKVDDYFTSSGVSAPVRIINDCMIDFVTPERIPLGEYRDEYIVIRTSVLCDIASFLADVFESYKMIDNKFFMDLDKSA